MYIDPFGSNISYIPATMINQQFVHVSRWDRCPTPLTLSACVIICRPSQAASLLLQTRLTWVKWTWQNCLTIPLSPSSSAVSFSCIFYCWYGPDVQTREIFSWYALVDYVSLFCFSEVFDSELGVSWGGDLYDYYMRTLHCTMHYLWLSLFLKRRYTNVFGLVTKTDRIAWSVSSFSNICEWFL